MTMHNPPHPGEFIRSIYLEPFGMSARALAELLRRVELLEEALRDLQQSEELAMAVDVEEVADAEEVEEAEGADPSEAEATASVLGVLD